MKQSTAYSSSAQSSSYTGDEEEEDYFSEDEDSYISSEPVSDYDDRRGGRGEEEEYESSSDAMSDEIDPYDASMSDVSYKYDEYAQLAEKFLEVAREEEMQGRNPNAAVVRSADKLKEEDEEVLIGLRLTALPPLL